MCVCYVYVCIRACARSLGWVMMRNGSCPEATVSQASLARQLRPLSRLSMCLWLEATLYLNSRHSCVLNARLRPTGGAHFNDVTVTAKVRLMLSRPSVRLLLVQLAELFVLYVLYVVGGRASHLVKRLIGQRRPMRQKCAGEAKFSSVVCNTHGGGRVLMGNSQVLFVKMLTSAFFSV